MNTQTNPHYQNLSPEAKFFFDRIANYINNAYNEFLTAKKDNNKTACQQAIDKIIAATNIVTNISNPAFRPSDLVKELENANNIPDVQDIFLSTIATSPHP